MRDAVSRVLAVASMLVPTAALAHSGHGETAGFVHGFVHPFGGVDHLLAMVAIGMLAYQLGGRALWIVPSVFVVVMGVGGVLGASHVALPYAEAMIAASIVVLGAAIAFGIKAPVAIAAAVAGLFAVFHGYAHGAEMPAAGSAASYAAGFMTATAVLHVFGIALGVALGRLGQGYDKAFYRAAGCLIAVVGAVILTQIV
jgi:urease accessory protein